jgi:hypothetical protein
MTMTCGRGFASLHAPARASARVVRGYINCRENDVDIATVVLMGDDVPESSNVSPRDERMA